MAAPEVVVEGAVVEPVVVVPAPVVGASVVGVDEPDAVVLVRGAVTDAVVLVSPDAEEAAPEVVLDGMGGVEVRVTPTATQSC